MFTRKFFWILSKLIVRDFSTIKPLSDKDCIIKYAKIEGDMIRFDR